MSIIFTFDSSIFYRNNQTLGIFEPISYRFIVKTSLFAFDNRACFAVIIERSSVYVIVLEHVLPAALILLGLLKIKLLVRIQLRIVYIWKIAYARLFGLTLSYFLLRIGLLRISSLCWRHDTRVAVLDWTHRLNSWRFLSSLITINLSDEMSFNDVTLDKDDTSAGGGWVVWFVAVFGKLI